MKNNFCDKLSNNELMYNYGTRPALSSVTSPVANLPLVTKVLSVCLFINSGLIKLLGLNISEDLRVVHLGTNLLGHFSCHLVGDFSIIHNIESQ